MNLTKYHYPRYRYWNLSIERVWQAPLHWLMHKKDGTGNNYLSYWFCQHCCDIRVKEWNESRKQAHISRAGNIYRTP